MPINTVHSLWQGYARCGFPSLPQHWPEGHLWSNERTAINCKRCLELFDDAKKTEQAQTAARLAEQELNFQRSQEKLSMADELVQQAGQSLKKPKFTYTGRQLKDTDPCPVRGKCHGWEMKRVPSDYLDWLDGQSWFQHKYPSVKDYIQRSRKSINQDLDRKERE